MSILIAMLPKNPHLHNIHTLNYNAGKSKMNYSCTFCFVYNLFTGRKDPDFQAF